MNLDISLKNNIKCTINTTEHYNIAVPVDNQHHIIAPPCADHSHTSPASTSAQNNVTHFNTNAEDQANRRTTAFWLPPPTIAPIEIGGWVGAIDAGANVNVNNITLCCHGQTHTECIGHISTEKERPATKDVDVVDLAEGTTSSPQADLKLYNIPTPYNNVLYHAPAHLVPGVLLKMHFVRYKELVEEELVGFDELIFKPFVSQSNDKITQQMNELLFNNPHYNDDDIVLSTKGIKSALVELWGKYCVHQDNTTTTPTEQAFQAKIDLLSKDINNVTITQLLLSIPQSFHTFLTTFSSSALVLCTFLPQCHQLMTYYDKHSEHRQEQQVKKDLIHIQQEYHQKQFENVVDKKDLSFVLDYSGKNSPYLPAKLMLIIIALFTPQYILSDLPSLDREDDGGVVAAHKVFFLYQQQQHEQQQQQQPQHEALAVYNIFNNINPSIIQHTAPSSSQPTTPPRNIYNLDIKRTNTEICWFPNNFITSPTESTHLNKDSHSTLIMADLRCASIASDATLCTPIIYPVVDMKQQQ